MLIKCLYFSLFLPAEMMDSSTFKRFSLSIDSILENLEDVEFNGNARAIYPFFVEFTTLHADAGLYVPSLSVFDYSVLAFVCS